MDDGFATHPKILAAGPIPALIQVRAICYASQHKTDGFIPQAVISILLAGFEELGIDLAGNQSGSDDPIFSLGCQANEIDWPPVMVKYGLWERRDGGYAIHDYLHWNMSKSEYEKFIKQKSQAGKKGMKVRWQKELEKITPVITNAITDDITKPYHATSTSILTLSSPNLHSPKEGKESEKSSLSEGKESEKGERKSPVVATKGKHPFPVGLTLATIKPDDPTGSGWAKFGINPAVEFATFRDHALTCDRRCTDWKAAWRNWARKAIVRKEARP